MLADVYTLETTYQLQLRSPNGDSWDWVSQAEYTSKEDCKELVARMYGGACAGPDDHRIIRHERHVES